MLAWLGKGVGGVWRIWVFDGIVLGCGRAAPVSEGIDENVKMSLDIRLEHFT